MRKKYKVSDYVAAFLKAQGIKHVFLVSGGASIHFLHSLRNRKGITPVPSHHEQAAAMSADGYARSSGSIGVAIATSGPGATNLITGIAGAWFDSVPCLFISGQVATFRMKRTLKVRQLGFQETEIVDIVRPLTKLAMQVKSAKDVERALQICLIQAITGRCGPVLLDIPDDIQREFFYFNTPKKIVAKKFQNYKLIDSKIFYKFIELIKESQRPVFVIGAGANGESTRKLTLELLKIFKIPILTTWGAKDLVPQSDPFLVGTFGSHGTRYGNFTVQNADLVIVLGSRLSSRETGGNLKTWARNAKLIHVDIDTAEIEKLRQMGKSPDLAINTELGNFLYQFINFAYQLKSLPSFDEWMNWVKERKNRYEYQISNSQKEISGYDFFLIFNKFLRDKDLLFLDTGCTVAWAMQAIKNPKDMRIFHDNNNTAMGWALPAAIGGYLAKPNNRITCISGDGSIMMNLQELATANLYAPNIKLIVLNNSGYGMVRQTEEQWLNGVHVGTDSNEGDIKFPQFSKLAKSFDFKTAVASTHIELKHALRKMYVKETVNFLEVIIDPTSKVIPQTRFGYPLEDSEPILTREELKSNMLIPLVKE